MAGRICSPVTFSNHRSQFEAGILIIWWNLSKWKSEYGHSGQRNEDGHGLQGMVLFALSRVVGLCPLKSNSEPLLHCQIEMENGDEHPLTDWATQSL